MNKPEEIIVLLFIFTAVLSGPLFAQGYPVIDIANLMQAVNTLYATCDQITAAIEQVQNTYQQLQKQIEMVKNMDWDKVGETIGDMDANSLNGILSLRHQIKDVTNLVNANVNLINNVQYTLTRKTVAFGGKRYTFGGLFGFGAESDETTIFDLPKNVANYVSETADDLVAGYAGKLTYKQIEDFYSSIQVKNKFIIGCLLNSPELYALIRRTMKKLFDNVRISEQEIADIIANDIITHVTQS